MQIHKYAFCIPCLSFLFFVCAGCATLDGQSGGYAYNILSTEDEIELGRKLALQVEEQETILSDQTVQSYVKNIGVRLAAYSPRQDVTYTFTVIDAPDTVNAFAAPGGFLYVYTGLMKICQNEAQLAGVLAHEIAHVAHYHHGQAMTRQVGYSTIASLILGESPSRGAELVAGLLGTTVQARYSRTQEYEADSTAMRILYSAGYSPDALIDFMYVMLRYQEEIGANVWIPIFSSHPPTQSRIESLQHMVQQYPAEARFNSPTYAQRYHEILSRLQ